MHRRMIGVASVALASGCGAGAGGARTEEPAREASHADHRGGGMPHRFADAEEWAATFDDPERDAWQRPDEVVAALALSDGMRVADVGAGTGYFAARLARAVPGGEVVATDVEPDMVRYLEARASREGLANLRAVAASASASGLAPASVDRVLVVNVWHHIEDRASYARDLAAALRPGGRVLVVDFRLDAERGPPPEHRLPAESVVADFEAAGLEARILPSALPEQYLVEARRAR